MTQAPPTLRPVQMLPCSGGVIVGTQAPDQEVVSMAGRLNESDDDDDPNDIHTAYQVAVSEEGSRKRQKRGKTQSNAEGVGMSMRPKRRSYHVDNNQERLQEGPRSQYLPNANDRKLWELCTVPEDLKCELFKYFDYEDTNKRLPRKHCNGYSVCSHNTEA